MKDTIKNLKKSATWKIQLTITIIFYSSGNTDEERVRHSKSDNIEFMIYGNAEEVIEEHFESFLSRYKIRFEASLRENDLIFDSFHLLYYKCRKINRNQSGSYIDSPD